MNDQSRFFDTEYIREFLLRKLGEKEYQSFIEELEKNEGLKEAVREEKRLLEAFAIGHREAFKAQMEVKARELDQGQSTASRPLWPLLSGAAAVLLLVVFLASVPSSRDNHLADEQLQEIPALLVGTKGDIGDGEQWVKAQNFYAEGKYLQAISLFEALQPSEEEKKVKKALYLGRSYLYEGMPEKAIATLSDHSRPILQFHLALAHLKAGQQGKAIQLLAQVKGIPYMKKSRKLLESLKESPYLFWRWW